MKKYQNFEMEIINLFAEDCITASMEEVRPVQKDAATNEYFGDDIFGDAYN